MPATHFEPQKGSAHLSKQLPLSFSQYERMAVELQAMLDVIRARPEMNHHFADRLALLSKEMREDEARVYLPKEK